MIRVQAMPFDPGGELNRFSAEQPGAGAVVSFTGVVRDTDGRVQAMEIEHYAGMTEVALGKIRAEAVTRWALTDALIIHRFGRLEAGEMIMMVATAAAHRRAAFDAADFLMDFLKSRAPFWKKEIGKDGADWVEATSEDEDALQRW